MAKFASAKDAIEEINSRKNSGGGGGGQFLKLEPGGEAKVRFLDEEPEWVWAHELPRTSETKFQGLEVCRDQDPETGQRVGEACPGCEQQDGDKYKRKMHSKVRLIQRDAPKFEEVEAEGKDGKKYMRKNFENQIGTEDAVVIWTCGKMAIEELQGAAATFKGLTTRDFIVKRLGTGGLDTQYKVDPAVDEEGETKKTPMSENDKALAEEAPEVSFRAPAYELWGKRGDAKGGQSSAPATTDSGPFKRRAAA